MMLMILRMTAQTMAMLQLFLFCALSEEQGVEVAVAVVEVVAVVAAPKAIINHLNPIQFFALAEELQMFDEKVHSVSIVLQAWVE